MAETVSFRAAPSASDIDRHIATIVHEGRQQFDKRKDVRAAVLALKAQAEGESVLRLMPPILFVESDRKGTRAEVPVDDAEEANKRNRAQKRQLAMARSGTDESAEARSEEEDEARLLLLRLSSSAHRWTLTLILVVLAQTWQFLS